ncbi:MAG: dipeptidase [Deltaproteobacteria bacterium]|nr:dipeptidase [Deltaproteobacteria bacterium]
MLWEPYRSHLACHTFLRPGFPRSRASRSFLWALLWALLVLSPVTLFAASSSPTEQAQASGSSDSDTPEARAQIEKIRKILREVPLIDGHNDVPWQYRSRADNQLSELDLAGDTSTLEPPMHTDLARLRQGGVGGQFWSVFVPVSLQGADAVRAVFEQIDLVHRLVERHSDDLELALSAADILRIHSTGKVASLVGMEGGHSIANSLGVLRQLYAAGARYMTLTHSANVDWADSATDAPVHGGLTAFGREVIGEMNRLGMLVDLSHVNEKVMEQTLDISQAPVIFSHSSAFALTPHPRNVPDQILERLKDNGGVVMVTFVPVFVSEPARQYWANLAAQEKRLESLFPGDPEKVESELSSWKMNHSMPTATLDDVADHIDHLRKVAGIDHVGIGSDFDGIRAVPVGLEDVSRYPDLLAELARRGYSDDDLRKITGLNALRAFEQAEKAARRLQKEKPPSEALIEDLDGEPDTME